MSMIKTVSIADKKQESIDPFVIDHALIVNFTDDIKRDRSDSSSDKNKPATKKRRLVDSDEEEEPLKSNYTETNGARVIISDDEESLSNVRFERPALSRVIISDEEDQENTFIYSLFQIFKIFQIFKML